MKSFYIITAAIFILIITAVALIVPMKLSDANKTEPFYVGVSFCGDTAAQAKLLIDKVKPYTNLFVLQSFPISRNKTAINEILDYATNQDLYIIVNLSSYNQTYWPMQLQIFKNAQQRWGDKFLGAYYSDEPGGLQIDYDWTTVIDMFQQYNWTADPRITSGESQPPSLYYELLKIQNHQTNNTTPQDYNLEAQVFQEYFTYDPGYTSLKQANIKTFVSDYALYWFDYQAGYDVVLSQFGANNSITQNIDLIRGAARLQNKDWGAIITWKYDHPPYLDTGDEIYRQMLTAYQAGAKYVILFDYPYSNSTNANPYGVLEDEHFYALEKFSNDVMATSNMRTLSDESKADAVLVLPPNYGWGMRWQNDVIWGFWGPDDKSPVVWSTSRRLLSEYGLRLDIVFDDAQFPVAGLYDKVYYWNETVS